LYRKFTKRISELQGQAKEYTGLFYRATTPSYDLETEVDQTYPTDHINEALIHETVKQFLGEIDQNHLYSLLLKMVYACMNTHVLVKLLKSFKKRPFTNLKLPELSCLKLTLGAVCSKGTYIRSLAYDFGQK
jgi:tRNA pseudouridine55 synthase